MSVIIVILSSATPLEIIQKLQALAVDSPREEGRIKNATVRINAGTSMLGAGSVSSADVQLRLLREGEATTSEEFSWLQLKVDAETIYHVVWIVAGILTILTSLKPYIQDIREVDTDLIVPFEQLVERVIKSLGEQPPQSTSENHHHQEGGNHPHPSDGD